MYMEGQRGETLMDKMNKKEVKALISLLLDDDPKILNMVWEHLLEIGEPALPLLEEAAEGSDPRIRIRTRHAISRIRLDLLERQFQSLALRDDASFDLEEALCVVARIEYPTLQRSDISKQLDEIVDAIRPALLEAQSPRDEILAINSYLFDDMGIRGNTSDYYDPDNNFINKVLEKKTGIPISLSAVYVLLGQRLGLPIRGVGLPGHFLAKYDTPQMEIFLDPFNRGRLLTKRDCAQILTKAGYYFKEEYISVASSRDIVIRMLRNLVISYSKRQEKTRIRRLTHYMELLQSREKAR
jgi:regulator of sirC expression with transglutaminase-like and TPR domain